MKFKVRKAKITDLKAIQDLNNQLMKFDHQRFDSEVYVRWPYSKPGKDYFIRSITKPRAKAIVAEVEGKIIGYLVGWIWIRRPYRPVKTAELDNMLVLPKYRSHGLGRALVREFLAWCRSKKVKSVEVWIQLKNKRGKKFYQSSGFIPVHERLEKKL